MDWAINLISSFRTPTLEGKCKTKIKSQGFKDSQIAMEPFLHMRYHGTDCALMCSGANGKDFMEKFIERYKTEFGIVPQSREIIIDEVRVEELVPQMLI